MGNSQKIEKPKTQYGLNGFPIDIEEAQKLQNQIDQKLHHKRFIRACAV